jgi:hypothetical protein
MNRDAGETTQCLADTLSGDRCTNAALPGQEFCYYHLHERYLQRAVRRAIVVSAVLLAATIAMPYLFPELARFFSCFAILAATVAGLEIAVLKARKAGKP